MRRGLVLLPCAVFAVEALACGPPSAPTAGPGFVVTPEPGARLTAVSSVLRLRVTGLGSASASLLLVEGEIGTYHAGRLRQGELPGALVDRRVAAIAWDDREQGGVVLAPSVPLAAGETYTLAALGEGPLAAVTVRPQATRVAARLWPPLGAPRSGSRSVFCVAPGETLGGGDAGGAGPGSAAAPSLALAEVRLDPVGLTATALEGADTGGSASERCLHLDVDDPAPAGLAVPPPAIGGLSMDPAPIALDAADAFVRGPPCLSNEVPLGPGCARVEDDRAVVRSADVPLLWAVRVGASSQLEPLLEGARFALTHLAPSSDVSVEGTVTDLTGREAPFTAQVATGPPRPHVVLSEVLANPLGPEPACEWVEIENDGDAPVDVGGFVLRDSGGDTVLPGGVLESGAFALIVGADFEASGGRDVPPAPGTLLVRVRRVGASGLSNSGEALVLTSKAGQVLSRFPSIAAPKPGVSAVRRAASAPDDDASAFVLNPNGSASPGLPEQSAAAGAVWSNHIAAPE